MKQRGGRQQRRPGGGNRRPQTPAQHKARNARDQLTEKIVRVLGEGRGHKTRSLFNLLGRPLNYAEFCGLLDELRDTGRIRKDELRRWVSGGPAREVKGLLFKTASGSGYLQADDTGEKILMQRRQLDRLLQEDWLKVKVVPGQGGGPSEGRVVELLERRLKKVVGRLARYGSDWALFPESLKFAGLIRVKGRPPEACNTGDRVIATLLPDPDGDPVPSSLWVTVLDRIQEESEARQLQEAIKAEFNLPGEFFSAELAEAGRYRQVDVVPTDDRIDLRDTTIFTIDPEDAKDFDDALSIRNTDDGWELGVHIADVSHFVAEGGGLDRAARRRGCSVYLPGEVIPMLPHALSSGLCSLAEGVDRYTFSVFMHVSRTGEIGAVKAAKSLIRSSRRFTYAEVQDLIDGKVSTVGSEELDKALGEIDQLWRLLKRRRMEEGGLDFALPEAGFKLDEEGNPLEPKVRRSREANFLVEECMLLANKCVAGILADHKRPCVYRIHEEPGGEKLERFRKALGWLGLSAEIKLKSVKDWQQLLAGFHGLPEEAFLNRQVLRSMMKARYDLENPGHFGLGFDRYAHFTSPIRRYPDLQVHRLLKQFLLREASTAEGLLMTGANRANQRELLAMESERAAIKVKQVLYLSRRLGESFEATISGVERFGIFVELDDVLADALIPAAEMPDEYWELSREGFEARGKKSGLRLRIGDRVTVQVLRTNLEKREVDCRFDPGFFKKKQS